MTDADKLEKFTRSIEKLCTTVETIRDCMRELIHARDDHAGTIEQLMAGQSAIAASVAAMARRLDVLKARRRLGARVDPAPHN